MEFRRQEKSRYNMTRHQRNRERDYPDLHRAALDSRLSSRLSPLEVRGQRPLRCDITDMSSLCCSSEDDRRERDRRERRRREERHRRREEEEEEQEEERRLNLQRREKRKTGRARICGWAKCCYGSLIVCGLIFVFFFITTLIIDGSSPFDYFIFKTEEPLEPVLNTTVVNITRKNPTTPTDSSTNLTDYSFNESGRNKTKSVPTTENPLSKVPKNVESSSVAPNGEEEGESFIVRTNHVLKPEQYPDGYLRPGVEEEGDGRGITYIDGPSGKSYAAYAPVPLDIAEELEEKLGTGRDDVPLLVKLNRYGEIEDLRGLDDNLRKSQKSIPGQGHRQLERDENHNYFNRRPGQGNLGSSIVPQYVFPPSIKSPPRDVGSHNLHLEDRNPSLSVHQNNYDSRKGYYLPPRLIGTKRGSLPSSPHSSRRYLRVSSRGSDRSRERYRRKPSRPSRYANSRTKNYSRNPYHRSHYNTRQPYKRLSKPTTDSQRYYDSHSPSYGSNSKSYRRPPREFRYPSSAKSIQDIIEYMKNRDEGRGSLSSFTHDRSTRPRHDSDSFKIPKGHVVGDQDHILWENRKVPPGSYSTRGIKEDDGLIVQGYDPSSKLGYADEPYVNIRNDEKYLNDRRNLPPVRNTYEPSGVRNVGPTSKSKGPVKIILDIYPAEDMQLASNILKSSLSLEGGYLPKGKTSASSKQEVILHLNLFTEKPSYKDDFSVPGLRRRKGVALEIPLSGSLAPLDIYKSLVREVKTTPVASPQTGLSMGSEPHIESGVVDLGERSVLFASLEEGLRKLNSVLPEDNKIVFSKEPVTIDSLVDAEEDVEASLVNY